MNVAIGYLVLRSAIVKDEILAAKAKVASLEDEWARVEAAIQDLDPEDAD